MTDSPYVLTDTRPVSFNFQGVNDKPLLTITRDGQVIVGEGLTPDEAGRAAIEGMRHHLGWVLEDARWGEREACAKLVEENGYPELARKIRHRKL